MEKRKTKTIILLSLVVLYIIVYNTFLYETFSNISMYLNAAASLIFAFLSIFMFGLKKDKLTSLKKSVLQTTLLILIAFFGLYYGAGLFLGYLQTPYTFGLTQLATNIIPTILTIIGIETFRYVMVNKQQENKASIIVTATIICLFELVTTLTGTAFINLEETFKITSQIILPVIGKNYVLTYLIKHSGMRSVLLYRLVMDLYIYIVPIVPDIGDYLNASAKIALPMLLLVTTYRQIDDTENGVEYDFKKTKFKLSDAPIIAFILIMSCLVSGKFNYYLIGIGSESMAPRLKKGDAVLIDKKKTKYKKDDIVAFDDRGKLVIHRIIEVNKKDGKISYKTKGDANITADVKQITNKDIIGKVKFRVKYIGYPSIFLKELSER